MTPCFKSAPLFVLAEVSSVYIEAHSLTAGWRLATFQNRAPMFSSFFFGCARERAGDYYRMGCRIPAVEGATVELNPYVSKKIGPQAICSDMLQMTTGSKYLGKSDNLQQSFLVLALLEFWAK